MVLIRLMILLLLVGLWGSSSKAQTSGGGPFTHSPTQQFCDVGSSTCYYPYKVNVTTGSIYSNTPGTVNIVTGGGSSSGGSSQWTTINTNDVYLPNNGNVGIGTTLTTTSALTVMNGNVGIGTWKPINTLGVNGSMAVGSYVGANTAPSNSLIVSGNLGVGNPNPSVSLEVDASGTSAYLDTAHFYAPSNNVAGNATDLNFGAVNSIGNSSQWRFVYAGNNSGLNRVDYSFNGYGTSPLSVLVSGNVGIGSILPGQLLDVQGVVRNNGEIVNGNVGVGTNLTTTSALTVMNGNVGIGTWNPQGKLHILSGNVLLGTGNVGIGSTAPGQALDVNGTVRTTGFTLTGNGASAGFILQSNGSLGIGTWVPAPSGGGGGGSTNPGGSPPQLQYASNGTTFGGIGSGGTNGTNIGIGTVNFSNILSISGNIGIGSTSTDSVTSSASIGIGTYQANVPNVSTNPAILIARNLTLSGSGHAVSDNGFINLSGATPAYSSYDARYVVGGASTYDHAGAFQNYMNVQAKTNNIWGLKYIPDVNATVANSSAVYDRLNPDSSTGTTTNHWGIFQEKTGNGTVTNYYGASFQGNVGIGTTTPATGLEVEGNGSGVFGTSLEVGGKNLTAYSGTAPEFLVTGTASNQFILNKTSAYSTSGGGSMLLVADTGSAITSGNRMGALCFGSDTDGTPSDNVLCNTSIFGIATENWSGSASGGELDFYTNANGTQTRSERMTITNSGNVGIGTFLGDSLIGIQGSHGSTTVGPVMCIGKSPLGQDCAGRCTSISTDTCNCTCL